MFERCTDPAKRAIFYTRCITLLADVPKITSIHLFGGLLWGEDSRAQTLFQLRERFPLWCPCPSKFAKLPKPGDETLTDHSKMILAWAVVEANRMEDYWIDTEHFLLGILRVPACRAAQYLAMAGLTLEAARKTITDNKPSRPDYGPVPRWWRIKARLLKLF
jgi:ATP-dependent Clp protease ATP-binding subunit ClpA